MLVIKGHGPGPDWNFPDPDQTGPDPDRTQVLVRYKSGFWAVLILKPLKNMHKSLIQGGIVYKWFCNQLLTPIVNNRSYFPKKKGFVNVLFEQVFCSPDSSKKTLQSGGELGICMWSWKTVGSLYRKDICLHHVLQTIQREVKNKKKTGKFHLPASNVTKHLKTEVL